MQGILFHHTFCWVCFGPHILSQIFERAWAYCGMLRLREACRSSPPPVTHLRVRVSASGWFFLLVRSPRGFHHILCNVATPPFALSGSGALTRPFPSIFFFVFFFRKTPAALPAINNPSTRAQVGGRFKIISPINHPRALERRLAPPPPRSGAVTTIRRDINVGRRGLLRCRQRDV